MGHTDEPGEGIWEDPPRRRGWGLLVAFGGVLLVAGLLVVGGDDPAGLPVEVDPTSGERGREPGAGGLAPEAGGLDHGADGPEPEAETFWVRAADATGTWVALSEAPLTPRSDPITVWTGAGQGYAPRARGEVLLWGGHRHGTGLADGAAYDPFTGEWRALPPAPRAWTPASGRAAAWTGEELLVLAPPQGEEPAAGLAYDPAADRWRETAPPPLRFWHAAGWTGEELVALAFARDLRTHRAAAYDPATDRWRRVPPARVLGDEATLLATNLPAGLAVLGEAAGRPAVTLLAPGAETWTDPEPLPDGAERTLRPLLASATVDRTTGRLLVTGAPARRDRERRRVWAWSPAHGWEELPELAPASSAAATELAWGGGRLLAWHGDGAERLAGAVFEADGRWRPMAPPPLSPRRGAGTTWTGRALVVWGGEHDGEPLGDGAVFLPWSGLGEGRLRAGG